jgi:YVTN family beta-propeller protein
MPSAVTVDPHTGEIYVANYNDGSVTRLGSDAPVTIAVGKHPQAIAVDPEKKLVYVANTQESTVSVIDVEAHRVVRTVDAGEHPYAIAIDRRTHVAYVANLSGNPFTQIGKE